MESLFLRSSRNIVKSLSLPKPPASHPSPLKASSGFLKDCFPFAAHRWRFTRFPHAINFLESKREKNDYQEQEFARLWAAGSKGGRRLDGARLISRGSAANFWRFVRLMASTVIHSCRIVAQQERSRAHCRIWSWRDSSRQPRRDLGLFYRYTWNVTPCPSSEWDAPWCPLNWNS